ncbi:MAG: hypothetical protein KDA21_05335, partial [Phycisphaerales bacterium]|nr:hypothetical protein [Phycisphaerales bacterium]
RGRSGRQGDNGSSRFFVSLEDDLMQMFAGETTLKILSKMGMKEGDSIEHPMMSKSLVRAQRKVEERNFSWRKNILEYDEIMEHQRQDFYGMRQRVLDGRDLKEMIFDFIEQSVHDAVGHYLDRDFTAECVAEYAREAIGCSIPVERLRNKDRDDLMAAVRRAAREEAVHEINMTLGEYLPSEGDEADQDIRGLAGWAMERFNLKVTASDVHDLSRRDLINRLQEAAAEQIDNADLSGIAEFCIPNHGAVALTRWLKDKTGISMDPATIIDKETTEEIVDAILDNVHKAYATREVEYPVSFRMSLTMSMMQRDPKAAAAEFVRWANRRYNLGWEESVMRTRMPQQIQDDLVKAARQFSDSDAIEKAVEEALACTTREQLQQHFRERYDTALPHYILRLSGKERDDLVRARVESILREELVYFERAIMLEVLDPAWKEHLYRMDQLRDTIGFRAFSQSDPRIEYKREGARMYDEMLASLRDKVTEYTFTRQPMPRLAPRAAAPPQRRPPAGRPAPIGAPAPLGSGTITGPGFDAPMA